MAATTRMVPSMPPPMYMWISWQVSGRQCNTLSTHLSGRWRTHQCQQNSTGGRSVLGFVHHRTEAQRVWFLYASLQKGLTTAR